MGARRVNLEDIDVDIDYTVAGQEENVGTALRRLEFQRQQRLQLVPTDDLEVRTVLGLLNEPEETLNEDKFSRRERLAELLFNNEEHLNTYKNSSLYHGHSNPDPISSTDGSKIEEEDEDFYTPATAKLIEARKFILPYSIDRSMKRLQSMKERALNFDIGKEINTRRQLNQHLEKMQLVGSQIVSIRPISKVCLMSDNALCATGSWAGDIKILDTKTLDVISGIENGHDGKIGGLAWNSTNTHLVSGADDCLVKIHSFDPDVKIIKELTALQGHTGRVVNVDFHPSGRFVASASFDMTWRLWDIESETELQFQEGHGKEVYSLSFQNDGALLCSGGLDNAAIVWDVRTGKSIMNLQGHAKPIYSVDWSPDGYHIATGGGDGVINIWDIRKTTETTRLLAHNNICLLYTSRCV